MNHCVSCETVHGLSLKNGQWMCTDCRTNKKVMQIQKGICASCETMTAINDQWLCADCLEKINTDIDNAEKTRREFTTGAYRDRGENKGRYDLLPWDAIHELALHCERGAIKYGERNAEKGIPISSFMDSAFRHLTQYMQGKKDENHAVAALWNIAYIIWTEKNKPEMQDIPTRKEGPA